MSWSSATRRATWTARALRARPRSASPPAAAPCGSCSMPARTLLFRISRTPRGPCAPCEFADGGGIRGQGSGRPPDHPAAVPVPVPALQSALPVVSPLFEPQSARRTQSMDKRPSPRSSRRALRFDQPDGRLRARPGHGGAAGGTRTLDRLRVDVTASAREKRSGGSRSCRPRCSEEGTSYIFGGMVVGSFVRESITDADVMMPLPESTLTSAKPQPTLGSFARVRKGSRSWTDMPEPTVSE